MRPVPKGRSIYARLENLIRDNKPVVLSTIIDARGSTPQVPGASALFTQDGLYEGTLGGGVLELDAQNGSLEALQKKQSFMGHFSLKAGISDDRGAICGGEVQILFDASPEQHSVVFESLIHSLKTRLAGVLVTLIDNPPSGDIGIRRFWLDEKERFILKTVEPCYPYRKEIESAFDNEKSFLLRQQDRSVSGKSMERLVFFQPVFPLPQLLIAGAGHIGQVVAHLGSLLNFEVTVIDDRPEFANKERFLESDHIIVKDIGKAIEEFPLSDDTFVVIVTRDHRHDADALRECIRSKAAYIGMIGSRNKIRQMRQKFLEQDWATDAQFDRVYAPVGIDIHSETVEEIAVSISAQLVQVRGQIRKLKGKSK